MKKSILFVLFLAFLQATPKAQGLPVFGPEVQVTIVGLSFDAMEPFISPDGNALFFNSLNDGINTAIYYSAKVNDSVFSLIGEFPVVNQPTQPRLDGVASLDSADNFYWVSTRDYPAEYDNLHHVTFDSISYSNFGRVRGDFNIHQPGWLIMDAGINYQGDLLYYCNAFFDTCGVPCFAKLGIARKVDDSTFNKVPNAPSLLASINDTANHFIYAPCISKDGLELYYSRSPHGTLATEVLVAVRPDTNSPFGTPMIIDDSPSVPEAPTLTTDKSILYYHKKVGQQYRIFMRRRIGTTNSDDASYAWKTPKIFPNPGTGSFILELEKPLMKETMLEVLDLRGHVVHQSSIAPGERRVPIDMDAKPDGIYFLKIENRIARIVLQR